MRALWSDRPNCSHNVSQKVKRIRRFPENNAVLRDQTDWAPKAPEARGDEILRFLSATKPECTKIAHRRSLAIFTADEGIAGNSAARTIFTHFIRRRNRGSLAIFFAEEIAHLGASKTRAIFWGAVKIAAATAENRAILVHSAQDIE